MPPVSTEIERRFLVPGPWPQEHADAGVTVTQGYLPLGDEQLETRLRICEGRTRLTVKSGSGLTRTEAEQDITELVFHLLWPLTRNRRVTKTRYLVEGSGDALTYEVDVFQGPHQGLVMVEVEFADEATARSFEPPGWFGADVTADPRHNNRQLAVDGMPREPEPTSPEPAAPVQGTFMVTTPDEKIQLAMTVAEEYAAAPDVDAIYLAGSLPAGLGNARSDVDLFVISNAVGPGVESTRQHRVGDQRVDVEIRDATWLKDLAGRFPANDLTLKTFIDIESRKWPAFDPVVRLMRSTPLKSSPLLEETCAALTEQEPALRQLLITKFASEVINSVEDCVGALESEDVDTALLISHQLLCWASQAFLAGCGDLYLGNKWIPAKLQRSAPRWAPLILQALAAGATDPRSMRDLVHTRIRLSQTLSSAAHTFGWSQPDAARHPLPSQAARGPLRPRDVFARRADDGALIADLDNRQILVSAEGLLLWGLCDGRPRDEVVSAVIEHNPQLDRAEVSHYLDQLISRGFVTGTPGS